MKFDERYTLAIAELKRTPIVEGNYAPPLHRFLRGRGVRIKPPHYNSIGMNIVTTGAPFAILWGAIMWFILWQSQKLTPVMAIGAALVAGTIFGLFMALYYRWSFKQNALTKWDKLEPTSELETPKEVDNEDEAEAPSAQPETDATP
ncbi:DUF6404 family protein [uncultured Cohaesibacter sp.]|uniref:DUF6404 family protein n=1 Tax=uncultured Cohaesibacter sp. TaxID=1002546 RepID=UPI002AABD799|nr:DUF6404 family protein [uncultured Cohaesibacter sp.]